MKKSILILTALLTIGLSGCFDTEPDLAWNDVDYVYNPCTNTTELLDTRNLYFAPNAGFPFNNYPQFVLLYWREAQGGFFDCVGQPWYIVSLPVTLVSYRYMTNRSTGTGTAKSPRARAYTKVRDNNGNEQKYDGPVVTFGDMPAGSSQQLQTDITIAMEGTYTNSYEADPDEELAESDESNNRLFDSFSRSKSGSLEDAAPSFRIRMPAQEELAKIKTRYVLYRNGQIEEHN